MKRTFFIFVLVFIAVATVGYLLWLAIDACIGIYKDRQLGKELDELEAMAREKKQASSKIDGLS